ncbi:MAG: McrB family protein [Clostridia bacterium]
MDMTLFNEFKEKWPLARLRTMTLDEYSKAKRKTEGEMDTFTYWLEAKLQDYGSIWGGSSFKFGIYSRNDTEAKITKAGRTYSEEYAWYAKYGNTEAEAFEKVRSCVVAVAEAAQQGNLKAIDEVDLGDVYKWKIAFHYQKNIADPCVLDIYDPLALRFLADVPRRTSIAECHKKLLAQRKEEPVFEYARALWARFQKSLVPALVDSDDNRLKNLNTIYYGPPGTGKTYQVLQFLRENMEKPDPARTRSAVEVIPETAVFWHLAPGLGGYLWSKFKEDTRLGYEWCRNEYGNLRTAEPANQHWPIIKRFSLVKKGDYFVVVSGVKVFGLAQALHDYKYEKAITDQYEFQTIKVRWIRKFDIPLMLNTTQTMTFCRMNGGSRWPALVQALAEKGILVSDAKPQAILTSDEISVPKNYMLVTFHQSYSYEDFIQGIKPVLVDDEDETEGSSESVRYRIEPGVFYRACDLACQKASFEDLDDALQTTQAERKKRFENAQPFYLVIDEINRGNIANILGELITLMEADKRLGATNELIVDLPYSKKAFGVPSNLYVIGTMNTADRSVESLDSALRRRFSFIPTYPKPEVIQQPEEFNVDLARLLTAINSRIVQLLDKDHAIGHAYFTGIADAEDPLDALEEVFRWKIIPQLQEYFFNDPQRLFQVLGNDFIEEIPVEYRLFGQHPENANGIWSIKSHSIESEEDRHKTEQAYIGLYS